MKPLKLILKGWGPYKDTQLIDFSAIHPGGLFLITGSTGAGKTTIFDGITFALYGEVSGSVREKDSLRSDFAAPEMATGVELWFLHRGIRYRIVRNPRYNRAKLRGDGMTTENENGEIFRESGDSSLCSELLAVGSQQVTEQVTNLLGLDYRQFKQISLIAQGEFQQLLMASSKERTMIFRDIFQTGIYDTMTSILGRRVKQLIVRLEEVKHRMDEVAGSFRVEQPGWEALYQQKNRNYPRIAACVRQEQERIKEVRAALMEEQQTLEQTYKSVVQKTGQAKQANQAINSYQADCERLEQKQQLLQQLKEQRCQWQQQAKQLPKLQKEIDKQQEELRVLEEQRRQLTAWSREMEALKKLQQKYLELDAKAKQKKQEYEFQEDCYRKAAAGILAHRLVAGAPCPVCGATVHPEPARMTGDVPDEQRLEQLKAEAENWMSQAAEYQNKAASSAGALREMERSLGEWKEALATDVAAAMKALDGQINQQKEQIHSNRQLMEELEQAGQELKLQEEREKAAVRQLKESIRKPPIMEWQDITALNRQVREMEDRRRRLGKEKERIQTILSVNQSSLRQMEDHLEVKKALEESYGSLRQLERAACGSNNRKLVLEQYVLSVYFEEILRAANQRLRTMTGDRYELYRLWSGRDRRMKEGMELEVLDQYTGKRRSVRTLSGGEAFKAALALALGTSDVVQSYAGGIQVETLFVDEGFGALDSESLGQALAILAQLRGKAPAHCSGEECGGQRMIGIISHVEELKEQIDSQIIVEKTNNGSSIKTNFGIYF